MKESAAVKLQLGLSTNKDLAEKIDGCEWYATFDEVAEKVAAEAQAGDLIITLGCGDVYKVAEMIADKLT